MTRLIEIDEIEVYIFPSGTDKIYFTVNRPAPFPKEVVGDQPLILSAEAQRLRGCEYIQKTFGFAPTVVDTRTLQERKREDEERGKQGHVPGR